MDLLDIGWELYTAERTPDSSYGRVAQATRDHFLVWMQGGEVEAAISGHLRYASADRPCVGDWVVVRGGRMISEILPRRTKLSRKQPGKVVEEQVLAANIDVLFLVTGLDHDYNERRLERYLTVAHESGAVPVILLNKADLRADADDIVTRTQRRIPGVQVIAISAARNWGLPLLGACLRAGQTAAFIGSSGVGKSTIINRLLGEQRQATKEVRVGDGKGRHTTTQRELIITAQRWLLMDLPGLRELQLWADPERIDDAFSEIVELSANCRFRDCTHGDEPGCAVREGGLDPDRIWSYQKLKREAAFLERQRDVHVARATKKQWKSIEKEIRQHPKRWKM